FTGKELITMHGLNWQDYGARWLDNVVMQWTSVDPLCEKYYDISPYAYCSDDPIRLIDPNGRDWVMDNKTKKYTWQDNVTKQGNTPKGYSYVGHQTTDLLKSLGVKSSYSKGQNRRSLSLGSDKADPAPVNSRSGAIVTSLLPATKRLIDGEKAQATLTITPMVSTGTATDKNKSGLTFDGVAITGILTQRISNLTATGGGLEVTNGGKEYTRGPLASANVDNNYSEHGSVTTSVSGIMPADKLFPGSLQSANINAGTTDNGTIWIAPVSIDFYLQDNQ
uniref:RHS repeat-associated core domain-containing protein n=1 Tax=Ferroplasma sp. TaxID=2591003 RepID=UPI002630F3F9